MKTNEKNRLQTLVLATSSFLPLSFAGNDRNCQSDLVTLENSQDKYCFLNLLES
jgi:hypothetical protein